MEVADGVHTYSIERTAGPYAGESLSVHTIETPTATVQFGSGDEYTVSDVTRILEEREVDVLVAEHGDPDHYGGMVILQNEFECEIAVPEKDAGTLEDAGIDVDRYLRPGESYWDVRTIGVPGHSPGNMSFLYENVLIAGDSVVGSDFGRAEANSWSGPLAILRPESHDDDSKARRNVRLLLEYEYEAVLVTHGSNVLERGREAVGTLVGDLQRAQGD